MARTLSMGPFFGPIFTIIFFVDCLFFTFLEWWLPQEDIERAGGSWNPGTFCKVRLISHNGAFIELVGSDTDHLYTDVGYIRSWRIL